LTQTEPPLNPPENREATAEIFFESFNVGQGAVLDALARPRRGEGEDGLHGNVQPLDVERLSLSLSLIRIPD
jgi:hypothetical protein